MSLQSSLKSSFLCLVVNLSLCLLTLASAPTIHASGENWLTGYGYRKPLTVEGSTDGTLTNYQLKLSVIKDTGTDSGTTIYLGSKVLDSFNDIRFTGSDGQTQLDYWIESIASNTATVWVEVPSIPADPDTTTLYLYYDQADDTSASNADNTFAFFDDFNDNSIDTTKWTVTSTNGSLVQNSESGGAARMVSIASGAWHTGRWKANTNLGPGYAISTSQYYSGFAYPENVNAQMGFSSADSSNRVYLDINAVNWIAPYLFYRLESVRDGVGITDSISNPQDAWKTFDIFWTETENTLQVDGVTAAHITDRSYLPTATLTPQFVLNSGAGAASVYTDWFLVRAYASDPPTVTAGEEADPSSLIPEPTPTPTPEPSPTPEPAESPTPTPTPTPTPESTPMVETSNESTNEESTNTPQSGHCSASKPEGTPDLFQIDQNQTTATLYFAPAKNVSGYTVNYGQTDATDQHAVTFDNSDTSGVVVYQIHDLTPGSPWFFKVQAKNGCQAGEWSPVRSTSRDTQNAPLEIQLDDPVQTSGAAGLPSEKATQLDTLDSTPQEDSNQPTEQTINEPAKHRELSTLLPQVKLPPIPDLKQSITSTYQSISGGSKIWLEHIQNQTKETAEDVSFTATAMQSIVSEHSQTFSEKVALSYATLHSIWLNSEPTQIANVRVTHQENGTAFVEWSTNHVATSKINWGESYDYGQSQEDTHLTVQHKMTIPNLESGKTYYYEVMSQGKNYVFDARHEFVAQ